MYAAELLYLQVIEHLIIIVIFLYLYTIKTIYILKKYYKSKLKI